MIYLFSLIKENDQFFFRLLILSDLRDIEHSWIVGNAISQSVLLAGNTLKETSLVTVTLQKSPNVSKVIYHGIKNFLVAMLGSFISVHLTLVRQHQFRNVMLQFRNLSLQESGSSSTWKKVASLQKCTFSGELKHSVTLSFWAILEWSGWEQGRLMN